MIHNIMKITLFCIAEVINRIPSKAVIVFTGLRTLLMTTIESVAIMIIEKVSLSIVMMRHMPTSHFRALN